MSEVRGEGKGPEDDCPVLQRAIASGVRAARDNLFGEVSTSGLGGAKTGKGRDE
ncbi:hypothetical protein IF1G_04828 [Cordyceps javanica]|uniref:Uncharacterized protein n=1 Tax=Cordyceps javanica TaxID=43265 RepID=A0A545V3F8_9HYPO|nr:hypothetical protein IF1G_04828 [Cordyceps javanica]